MTTSINWKQALKKFIVGLSLILLAIISLASWSVSTPFGGTPDEDFHLVSIWCGQGDRTDLCQPTDRPDERLVPKEVVRSAVCYAFHPEISAGCQQGSFEKFDGNLEPTKRGNFEGLYPPVFHWVMSFFSSTNIYMSVFLMRLLNILIMVGIAITFFLMGPRKLGVPYVVGLLVSIVPLGIFLIGSVNPSSWAISTVGATYIVTLAFSDATGKWKFIWAGFIFTFALFGAGSRADTGIFIMLAIVLGLITGEKKSRAWPSGVGLLSVAALPIIIFFFTSSQVADASNGLGSVADATKYTGSTVSLMLKNFLRAPELFAGAFGQWGLGWLDTSLPAAVWVLGLGFFLSIFFLGLIFGQIRDQIALILALSSAWLLPVVILTRSRLEVGAGVQPRYILPLLILTSTIGVTVLLKKSVTMSKLASSIFAVLITFTNSISLFFNLKRYSTGIDITTPNLDMASEWSWPGAPTPMIVWIIGSVSFGIVCFYFFNKLGSQNLSKKENLALAV